MTTTTTYGHHPYYLTPAQDQNPSYDRPLKPQARPEEPEPVRVWRDGE